MKARKNGTKKNSSLTGKTPVGLLEIFPKLLEKKGNFVYSTCIFPNSKDKRYCDIFQFSLESVCLARLKLSQITEIGKSEICPWTGNTENLKMKFGWQT